MRQDSSLKQSQRSPTILLLTLAVVAALAAVGSTQSQHERPLVVAASEPKKSPLTEDERKQAAATPHQLPIPAPLPVDAALAAFEVAAGFVIECVASEPLVQAPVAMQFDEDGRLWVVEMRSYMPDLEGTNERLPTNRISVLEDTDNDGVFDRSTAFLDDLVLPRAVAPCYGGALVLEPPSLYFCRDTDGDGRADIKRKLLDGFGGIDNPEHAGNGLLRGLDNWYHFSQHTLQVAFDGTNVQTRAARAHGQWGLGMDDRGRFYYTPNSTPLLIDIYPNHLGSLNRAMAAPAGLGDNIAQPAATTWPIHPTPGVNRGYQDGILRADATLASLTAACGPSINRAGGLGEDARGDAFICEPAGGIVKRIALREEVDGVPKGRNAYDKREWIASRDERFRPVNTAFGPDGYLYIADMYRGVIQHKTYLTEYLKKQIRERNLETPLNMGRIYRVRLQDGKTRGPFPKISILPTPMLVELLSHEDGWYRDTAQRLIVERRALAAVDGPAHWPAGGPVHGDVVDSLRVLLRDAPRWQTRLAALGCLAGLAGHGAGGSSTDGAAGDVSRSVDSALGGDLIDAMSDPHPAVVTRAIDLSYQLGRVVDSGPTPAVQRLLAVRDRATGSPDVSLQATFAAAAGSSLSAEHAAFILQNLDSAVARSALIAGLPSGRSAEVATPSEAEGESAMGAVLLQLTKRGAWPHRPDDVKTLDVLVATLLRTTPAARLELVELAAACYERERNQSTGEASGKAAERSGAGSLMVRRIIDSMRLMADEPQPIKLSGVPTLWLRLAGESRNRGGELKVNSSEPGALAAEMERAVNYFEWPGRPVVKRAKAGRMLTLAERDQFELGKLLYSKCVGCHMEDGQGAPGQAPTLVASTILGGRPDRAVKVLLHGLQGKYSYGDQEFVGQMPAAALESDAEVAAVLTYCRRSFGNAAEPVTIDDVTRVRSATINRRGPWRREELK